MTAHMNSLNDETTEVTDMAGAVDYESERKRKLDGIGDSIRELQYLLAPEYEAQAERLRAMYFAAKRLAENQDDKDAGKTVVRLHGEIASGHALLNPLITGIELLEKARALL